jgi:hypothetical protein
MINLAFNAVTIKILFFVFYGYEPWFLKQSEEYDLRVLENRTGLRKTSGHHGQEVDIVN